MPDEQQDDLFEQPTDESVPVEDLEEILGSLPAGEPEQEQEKEDAQAEGKPEASEPAEPVKQDEQRQEAPEASREEPAQPVARSREQEQDEIIDSLRRQIAEMSRPPEQPAAQPEPQQQQSAPAPTPAPTPTVAQATQALHQWIKDDDVDALMDPKRMNDILNQVYAKARSDASEQTMLGIPQIVRNQVAVQARMQQLFLDFWQTNNDLEPYKDFVEVQCNNIAGANPQYTMEKLLEETATQVRKRLHLPAPKPRAAAAGKPAFVSQKTTRNVRQAPQPVDFDKEFGELLEG